MMSFSLCLPSASSSLRDANCLQAIVEMSCPSSSKSALKTFTLETWSDAKVNEFLQKAGCPLSRKLKVIGENFFKEAITDKYMVLGFLAQSYLYILESQMTNPVNYMANFKRESKTFSKDPSLILFQLFQDLRFVTVLIQRMSCICFSLQECNVTNVFKCDVIRSYNNSLHAFGNYRCWH